MPRHTSISLALVFSLVATSVLAQQPGRVPAPIAQQASAAGGHIRGIVRDDVGSLLGGVMIVALGTTLASATTDHTGRYSLALPPGEYILRATRSGYVSTYREPIRMQTSVEIERNITLVRAGVPANTVGQSGAVQPATTNGADHSHDEAAWRLRYLPRTALRDVAPGADGVTRETGVGDVDHPGTLWLPADTTGTPSLFANAGLRGQVNYLTTSVLPATATSAGAEWTRSVAAASLGAPVGSVGDWFVRGAFNGGGVTSWVLHGEYQSRDSQPHVLTLGLSHSAEVFMDRGATLATAEQSRSVGDIYGYDHWRATRWLELDYGLRVDRYDYLTTTGTLVSPKAGVRLEMTPGTFAVASASLDRVAPGADEFLPPAVTGPWLPPQHTFSSLGDAPLGAESVRTFEVGLDQGFGSGDHTRTFSVRRFRQSTENQFATLFGVDIQGDSSHYYVATPGDVRVDGWSFGVAGDLSPYLHGRVNYSLGQAAWAPEAGALALARVAPSAVRDGREAVHDLTTSLATRLPSTSTEVSFVYRMSSAFTQADSLTRTPQVDGRFDLEVHQPLPYQPMHGGRLEVLFALRNLFYDAHDTRSIYDELLTVKPPLRLVGGIQVRF